MTYYGLIVDNECISIIKWLPKDLKDARKRGLTLVPRVWDFRCGHDPDVPFEIKELKIGWEK